MTSENYSVIDQSVFSNFFFPDIFEVRHTDLTTKRYDLNSEDSHYMLDRISRYAMCHINTDKHINIRNYFDSDSDYIFYKKLMTIFKYKYLNISQFIKDLKKESKILTYVIDGNDTEYKSTLNSYLRDQKRLARMANITYGLFKGIPLNDMEQNSRNKINKGELKVFVKLFLVNCIIENGK